MGDLVTWNPGPHSTSTVGRNDAAWLARFRAQPLERQMSMLTALRTSLETKLAAVRARAPSSQWSRAMATYLTARAELAAGAVS